jgi:two-component system phosphate regulon sensor histidine kinase PhoR
MASKDHAQPTAASGLFGRSAGTGWVLAAAALVLIGFVALSILPVIHALIGFAVIAAAALLALNPGARSNMARTVDDAPAHAQEPSLDAVIASLPDAALVLDREGRLIAANAAALALAPALARGQPLSLALRMPEIVDAVRQVATSGEPRRVEFSQRVPVDRWFAAHVVPLAGPARLMMLVFHDLTPLRRVEEMRADFVANASHELRTPLAALSGFIDTLLGSARDDTAARERFLGIMKTQATRMARLIDDLLSLSRVELIEHLHPDKPVDLVAVVRQVTDGLQMLARDRGVEIALEPPPEPLIVLGDRDELTRMFENLVENALKYGASGKRVSISFATAKGLAGTEALVAVRDYGPGIAAEHLPRLTERFYRVDVSQSRAEGGTGLGLSLVKHILNRHRGRIVIESEAGQGATFTARLPLVHSGSV